MSGFKQRFQDDWALLPPYPGKRWLRVISRSLHILGVVGCGGGILYGLAPVHWWFWWQLAMVTGFILILTDVLASLIWLIQLRGVIILAKLPLLAAIGYFPEYAPGLLIVIVLLSGVIAHASGDVRYYSIWHRRRIESPADLRRS